MVPLDLATSTLTFTGFYLSYTESKMEIYPLALPMNYVKIQNSTTLANNQIVLQFLETPTAYMTQGNIYFSYIYFTNVYASNRIFALYQSFNENMASSLFSYSSFAFSPSTQSIFALVRTYTSINTPFFYLSVVNDLSSTGAAFDNFTLGMIAGTSGVSYNVDVMMLSNSFHGCNTG